MISVWNAPTPYYKRFSKKEPGNPFDNLLQDEGGSTATTFKFKSRKQKLEQAKKILLKAKDVVMQVIQKGKEGNLDISTQSAGLDTYFKTTELGVAYDLASLLDKALWLVGAIFSGRIVPKGELIVLNSSWLSQGIVSFYNTMATSLSQGELVTLLHVLVSKVNNYLYAMLGERLAYAAYLFRTGLMLIPSEGYVEEDKLGTLTVTIVKKSNPRRRYGPYNYPNVKKDTWGRMKLATGIRGQGAGTIFWREYLNFKNNRKGLQV